MQTEKLKQAADLLANQARTMEDYFETIINATNWPQKWKDDGKAKTKPGITPDKAASDLLEFAVLKGDMPHPEGSPPRTSNR